MIDQPGSIAQLALAVAAPAWYLYPGEAKTDRRDAYVLATPPGPPQAGALAGCQL